MGKVIKLQMRDLQELKIKTTPGQREHHFSTLTFERSSDHDSAPHTETEVIFKRCLIGADNTETKDPAYYSYAAALFTNGQ